MLRQLLTTTALTAALSLPIVAAQAQSSPAAPAAAASEQPVQHIRPDEMKASQLIGANVYDPGNHEIGAIKDIVINSDGHVAAVVIGVGGFVGIGEKYVAVPMTELKHGPAHQLMLDRTKDELKNDAPYDLSYSDIDEPQPGASQPDASQPGTSPVSATTSATTSADEGPISEADATRHLSQLGYSDIRLHQRVEWVGTARKDGKDVGVRVDDAGDVRQR
jgi:sporulation protein YlmC with PRC-barrel domain